MLGIWVVLLPYMGFPYYMKNALFGLTGSVLVYISLVMYKEQKNKVKNKNQNFDNFSENREFLENTFDAK